MMRYFILAMLLLLANGAVANSPPPTFLADAAQALINVYPDAKIIKMTSCAIGQEKTPAHGLLIQSKKLEAVILYKVGDAWQLYQVPTRTKNTRGSLSDFLYDYRKSVPESYQMTCTSPKTDKFISEEINGEFVAGFAKKFSPDVLHICFEASTTYNDAVCVSLNPSTHKPAVTFVQINAD